VVVVVEVASKRNVHHLNVLNAIGGVEVISITPVE
jgi:hypothetical protein